MDHANGTRVRVVRFILVWREESWIRGFEGEGEGRGGEEGKFLERRLKGMGWEGRKGGREGGFDREANFKRNKKKKKQRIVGGSIFGMEMLGYGC